MKYSVAFNFKKPNKSDLSSQNPIGTIYHTSTVGCNINGEQLKNNYRSVSVNDKFYFKHTYEKAVNKWYVDKDSIKNKIKDIARSCIRDKDVIMDISFYMFIHEDGIITRNYHLRKTKPHKAIIDDKYEIEWEDIEDTIYPATMTFEITSTGRRITELMLYNIFDKMVKNGVIASFNIFSH